MQYKAEVSGITGGAEYELVWDKDAVAFVMRPIKSNQIDMFEYSDQGDYQYEGSEDDAEA